MVGNPEVCQKKRASRNLAGFVPTSLSASRLLGNQRSISPLYELVVAREVANWQAVAHLSNQLDLSDEYIGQSHWSAVQLAHEATNVA